MGFAETAPLVAQLDLKGNFVGNLKKAQGALGQFSGSLGRAGKGIGQLGAGFARVGTIAGAAVVGGLVGAAKAAIDFEDAFAGVRKTIDEADLAKAGLSFEILAKQFRTMATEIPIAATELAKIGETAGALGIRAQDIEEFTRTVALLGATTNLTSDEAAESLGKVGTILGLTGDQFEDFADILVNLGNKGASTEAEIIEITKRFAASGRQAGLSTSQILAYASAIASAGAEPEAAGSSLSRLFGNLITETARATDKGKAFAEVVGLSFKNFSKIVENDTNGAMLKFLDTLKELSAFDQQRALKAVGITNVRDRNAILLLAETYDKNLVPALRNAEDATGALGIEAGKRFDAIRSKLKLLANNFTEAAITVGEGFTPAIGRAAAKLAAFLKVDANRSALKAFGEDIGKAIDAIDWAALLAGARTFYGVLKTIFDVINSLPTEIKAAAAAFLVLNKASGGLIGAGAGNIVGGLAGAAATGLASRAPGIGRIFAQPVFVTNWPLGGIGGAGGAGGGGGLLGKGFALLGAGALIAAAVPIGEAFAAALPAEWKGPGGRGESESQRRIREAKEQMARNTFGPPTPGNWANRGSEKFGPANPGFLKTGQDAQFLATKFENSIAPSLKSMDANLIRLTTLYDKSTDPAEMGKIDNAAARIEKLLKPLLAAKELRTEAAFAGAAEHRAGERMALVGAVQGIKIPAPMTTVNVKVNVTAAQVTKSVTVQNRYGPGGGSRDQGNRIGGQ